MTDPLAGAAANAPGVGERRAAEEAGPTENKIRSDSASIACAASGVAVDGHPLVVSAQPKKISIPGDPGVELTHAEDAVDVPAGLGVIGSRGGVICLASRFSCISESPAQLLSGRGENTGGVLHSPGEDRVVGIAAGCFQARCGGRVWFKCKGPKKPGCYSTQTIFCDRDARYLVPLPRTEAAYAAMRVSHQSYESKHRALRIQYLVAPDSLAIRPKRIGKAWQQVRASAAMVIDWLRIFQMSGWRTGAATVAVAPQSPTALRMVNKLAAKRAQQQDAKEAAGIIGAVLAALFMAPPGAPPPLTTWPGRRLRFQFASSREASRLLACPRGYWAEQ